MANIIINGNSYGGSSVVIRGNKVVVDGVDVTPDSKVIDIKVVGNIDELTVDYCSKLMVEGNVNNVRTSSGNVECKAVTGDITCSSGDVECGNVGGNISTSSGDVRCGTVAGAVRTMSGDIKNAK